MVLNPHIGRITKSLPNSYTAPNPYVVSSHCPDNVLQVSATRTTDEGKWKYTSFDQGQFREAGALRLINEQAERVEIPYKDIKAVSWERNTGTLKVVASHDYEGLFIYHVEMSEVLARRLQKIVFADESNPYDPGTG